MTSQSPRVYLYKITFEEVPYYYYGVKKEKYFNEEYWGSPKTNKWCWEFYTPKKQILELFEFTDEGYIEAQEVEKRIISPVLNDDWCLNENVGGKFSIKINRENGRRIYEMKRGVHGRTREQMSADGKKGGSISGEKHKQNKTGVCGRSREEIIMGGVNWGKKGSKNTNSQKWICLETEFVTNPGALTAYQRKRGIDTSKRKRIA